MLKEKYKDLIDYGQKLGIKDVAIREDAGKLIIKGSAPYQYEKELFWDKIKTYPKYQEEIGANILVQSTDIFGYYTVQAGDTLSKISKWHLDDANKYMELFNINKDILKDPNLIKVGQKLKLPNKK